AGLVASVLVAATRPLAHEGGARLRPIVPVRHRRSRTLDQELALLALGDVAPLLVDDAQLVAGNGHAGRAVADVVGAIGQENMQHLRRADAVQDVDSGPVAKAAA